MHAGEMRDTAELGSMAALMTEHWMPRNTRANLFRSWGSLIGMLPVGGPNIWGNTTWAPDDTPVMADRNQTHGYIHHAAFLCHPALCLSAQEGYAICLLKAQPTLQGVYHCLPGGPGHDTHGTVRLLRAATIVVCCSCFFSRKEGPYNRSWSFAQMKEAFSARSATDWLDWGIAKISLKVSWQFVTAQCRVGNLLDLNSICTLCSNGENAGKNFWIMISSP